MSSTSDDDRDFAELEKIFGHARDECNLFVSYTVSRHTVVE